MCEIDYDGEICDVWVETDHKARKPHQCNSCTTMIQPGETYTRHFDIFDGRCTTQKCCAECQKSRLAFYAAHSYHLPPSDHEQELSNCINNADSPEESAPWKTALKALESREKLAHIRKMNEISQQMVHE